MKAMGTVLVLLGGLAGVFSAGCATETSAPPSATPVSSAALSSEAMPTDPVVQRYVRSMRDDLSRGKVGIINEVMQLNASESKVFWPIYQEYEQELFALGDRRVEAIRRFAAAQRDGTLDNGEASRLASDYFKFESRRLELLRKYHDEIARSLSPVRAAQFAQIEHRVNTVIDLVIASELPLIRDASASAR